MTDKENPLEPKYEPGRSYVVKGALLNAIVRGLRHQRIIPGPGLKETATPMGRILRGTEFEPKRGRFEVWRSGDRLHVAPGAVSYIEVPTRAYGETPPAVITTPIVPTLDGVDLDDPEDEPYFDLGARTDGTVWLVCQQTRCSGLYASDSDEPERVVLTDRGAKPALEDGEHCVRLYDFDIEDGRLTNTKTWMEDDWEQWYRCDGDFGESNDSAWGSDEDSAGSGGGGSTPSGSEDPVPDDNCTVGMRAKWINKVKCFPKKPGFSGDFDCVPGQYTFIFEVEFFGQDPYSKPCTHWAYGVKMPGALTDEIVWLDSRRQTLAFTWESAPACDSPVLVWRARGYGPLKDNAGNIIPSCCGRLWSGQVPQIPVKLGPVCDCSCSSSLLE